MAPLVYLENHSAHKLRHTAATLMYQHGNVDIRVLKDILGHPMIWWVYKRVCTVEKLDEVYVATDDERIRIVCEANKIPVVMTASTHRAAAHRLQEVSETIKADFYVQLNGDEPLRQLLQLFQIVYRRM